MVSLFYFPKWRRNNCGSCRQCTELVNIICAFNRVSINNNIKPYHSQSTVILYYHCYICVHVLISNEVDKKAPPMP